MRKPARNIQVIEITDRMFDKHIIHIATRARQQDRDEWRAAGGEYSKERVLDSCRQSKRVFIVIEYEGVMFIPIALFGVVEISPTVGVPWMISTDRLKSIQSFFMRKSKLYIDKIKGGYSCLVNYVDKRNTLSIKWLRRCGFKIHDAEHWGYEKRLFHRFDMEGIPHV